jgi:hypothetical protein
VQAATRQLKLSENPRVHDVVQLLFVRLRDDRARLRDGKLVTLGKATTTTSSTADRCA